MRTSVKAVFAACMILTLIGCIMQIGSDNKASPTDNNEVVVGKVERKDK